MCKLNFPNFFLAWPRISNHENMTLETIENSPLDTHTYKNCTRISKKKLIKKDSSGGDILCFMTSFALKMEVFRGGQFH